MVIPDYVLKIIKDLERAGFEAYIVGGCVRDFLLGKEPQDWDVTTNAYPKDIMNIFPESKYDNSFGTVLVSVGDKKEAEEKIKNFEIITKKIKINLKDKEKAIKIAKKYLDQIECPVHNISHTERVVNNVKAISREFQGVNPDILEVSAWMHDVGRYKYNDKRHNEESLKIIKKELSFLNQELLNVVLNISDHAKFEDSKYLEQHILKEADMIDGIDFERTKIAQDIGLESHLEWIKNSYNWDGYYRLFITQAGKKLFKEKIQKFNESNFNFKLPLFGVVVEITTYRSEQGYSDRRHPDKIEFEDKLDKDLERRDFTINAMALRPANKKSEAEEIVDLFGGQKDLKKKIIRAVGEPTDRFKEDALRMLRAIRFASQLGFEIEPKTERAITKMAGSIKFVSNERIADELIKILSSNYPYEGIMAIYNTKLLQYILPELTKGVKVAQDRHHIHDVFTHSVLSLKHCPSKDWRVRFSALLHDIGKVQTRKIIKGIATFYNHEMVSAKLANKIMKRLHFSAKDQKKINILVRYHMFYYNTDEVTASSVRRLISRVGKENLKDLIDLRIADRLGSGTPKGKPYKLRHLEYMFEKVQNDPVSVKMLKINGDYMIEKMEFKPGPNMGAILDVLLSEVIEDPKLNNLKYLKKRAEELNKMDPKDLRGKAKVIIQEKRKKDDKNIKNKFWVK